MSLALEFQTQSIPEAPNQVAFAWERGKVDVIVTDPDDGSDCRSLNRKIPARVGDNKSQTGTWNSAESAKARTVMTLRSLGESRVWISITYVPERPMDAHVHTQNGLCWNLCVSSQYVCIKHWDIYSDSNRNMRIVSRKNIPTPSPIITARTIWVLCSILHSPPPLKLGN